MRIGGKNLSFQKCNIIQYTGRPVVNRLGGDFCKNVSKRKNKICSLNPLLFVKIEFENLSTILKFD